MSVSISGSSSAGLAAQLLKRLKRNEASSDTEEVSNSGSSASGAAGTTASIDSTSSSNAQLSSALAAFLTQLGTSGPGGGAQSGGPTDAPQAPDGATHHHPHGGGRAHGPAGADTASASASASASATVGSASTTAYGSLSASDQTTSTFLADLEAVLKSLEPSASGPHDKGDAPAGGSSRPPVDSVSAVTGSESSTAADTTTDAPAQPGDNARLNALVKALDAYASQSASGSNADQGA